MFNLFTNYPPVPWKANWRLSATAEDRFPLFTDTVQGTLTSPEASWKITLVPESEPWQTRLFMNGLSLHRHKRKTHKGIELLTVESGVFIGHTFGVPLPTLSGTALQTESPTLCWQTQETQITLLLCKDNRFVLVHGEWTPEQARRKAEDALEEDFETLQRHETEKRLLTSELFGANPRHNPPIAIAAESLRARLREPARGVPGLWSQADGFDEATFSINELYALAHAWARVDPKTALQLTQTTLSLQQTSGGFPAWVNVNGESATTAPWPLIAQTFEHVWECNGADTQLLRKTLPALRKYIQWALRYFDPHRDGIPAWQSEFEIFIPNSFERDKATPDLTAMLLEEISSLLRLCNQSDHSETATTSLTELKDQLAHGLKSIFWNANQKSFSNVWKQGHFSHEPSLGSFLPLLWTELPQTEKSLLLEQFELTRGHSTSAGSGVPAIHQFITLKFLQSSDTNRALLLQRVRRAREGFITWFERERLEAARSTSHDPDHPFLLGPVTASLFLVTQDEFQKETQSRSPGAQKIQQAIHRMQISRSEVAITLTVLAFMLIFHVLYQLPKPQKHDIQIAEAAVSYKQGQLAKTLHLCQQNPDHALSQFLRANLSMMIDQPVEAEALYYKALLQHVDSPSALFGYALSLHRNGKFDEAIKRYNDFLDIHETKLEETGFSPIIDLTYQYIRLAEEGFQNPPKWIQVYSSALMNDLGL